MPDPCFERLSLEEGEQLSTELAEGVFNLAQAAQRRGLCPSCTAELLLMSAISCMRNNSNLGAGDMVSICLDSVAEVYEVLVRVAEKEGHHPVRTKHKPH